LRKLKATSGTRAGRGTDRGASKSAGAPSAFSHHHAGGNPRTLAERVYRALKKDIILGVFPSGEAISENLMARRYRGSRTPVREAALRLQQENLLRGVPNRGYFVSHLSVKETNDMYEFRAAVEGACAEIAAQKGVEDSLLDPLQQIAGAEYQDDDRESYLRFIEADTSFHVGVARLARNPLLERAVSNARCQMERIMFAAIDIGYPDEVTVREHNAVLDAIRRRDPAAARMLMIAHILGSKEKVLQLASGRSRLL
jgi:DNA-binding GntR family transcriptional regulator